MPLTLGFFFQSLNGHIKFMLIWTNNKTNFNKTNFNFYTAINTYWYMVKHWSVKYKNEQARVPVRDNRALGLWSPLNTLAYSLKYFMLKHNSNILNVNYSNIWYAINVIHLWKNNCRFRKSQIIMFTIFKLWTIMFFVQSTLMISKQLVIRW